MEVLVAFAIIWLAFDVRASARHIATAINGIPGWKPEGEDEPEGEPMAAVMYCPWCGFRHMDSGVWKTRPHHTHLCASCGKEWRVEPYCYGAEDRDRNLKRS